MRYLKVVVGVVTVSVVVAAATLAFSPKAAGQVVAARSRGSDNRPQRLQIQAESGSELGISIRDVDQADVNRERLPAVAGAVVDEVRSQSPAEKAGLKAGDVIVEFDGERVRSASQLTRLVWETPAGRTVQVTVIRGGERQQVSVTPEAGTGGAWFSPDSRSPRAFSHAWPRLYEDLPDHVRIPEFDIDIPRFELQMRVNQGRLGVTVQSLTGQLGDYFGVEHGVLVSSVTNGSPAEKAGVKAGDVITAVGGSPVVDVPELRRRISGYRDGEDVGVTVVRDRKELKLTVKLEKPSARELRRRTLPAAGGQVGPTPLSVPV